MVRNASGKKVFYVTGDISHPDQIAKTTWLVPEHVPARNIKRHLCKDGPKMCKDCQLCEWGKFYLRMKEEEKKQSTNALMATV